MTELTQEYVKSLFDYRDGALYWKVDNRANKTKSKRVGYLRIMKDRPNYKRWYTTIQGKNYPVCRIIFLWHKGYLPPIVDHEDRNPQNDKIENLRDSGYSGNSKNRTSAKGSTSQYLGVCRKSNRQTWYTTIRVGPKIVFGGSFIDENSAALKYNQLAVKYHGEFASLNIINSIKI